MRLLYWKGQTSFGVGIPLVYKWVQSVVLRSPKKNKRKSYSFAAIITVHLNILLKVIPRSHSNVQVTVSLKVVSHKRRRKCTLESYDRFTNSWDL